MTEKYKKQEVIEMKVNDTDVYMIYDTGFIPKKFMEKCLENITKYFQEYRNDK